MMTEPTQTDDYIFTIKPSQWANYPWGIVTGIIVYLCSVLNFPYYLIVIPVFFWLCNWLILKCWSFDFHDRTISERKGVFSVLTREIHYFRIKSVRVEEPFYLRIFGLKTVVLITSDPLIPILRIFAIGGGNGTDVKDYCKEQAAKWRDDKSVKEQDIHPLM